MKLHIILTLCFTITCIESAKILGIFHMAAHSHFQLGDTLFKELARKGHEVTVISPYASKTPTKNIKEVVLTGAIEEMEKQKNDVFSFRSIPAVFGIFFLYFMGLSATEKTLNHPNVQKLLASDEKFDLVIMEEFANEAFRGFCYRYGTPCITVSTFGASIWINLQMGNPSSPSYVPEIITSYKSDMTFCQRIYNTLVYLTQFSALHLYAFPQQNKLLQKYFPEAPHLTDLYYNTSLALLNSHVSISNPVPYVPNMIDIGGYHVKPPKKLPNDLQQYLDNAKEGVILFSMGSNIKSKSMDPKIRASILKAFSKLKVQVLWKWEDENLPGKPDNVKISKWLPQNDILAHPNIKLFISHGGLLSTTETVYHGVPVIGIPIFGDQIVNIANAENSGFGIKLEYDHLTEETLSLAINKMLNDPSYKENVKKRSQILHDQPMKPIDKAMFWIEYVLRHNGAPHLKTAALTLNWYQYLLLDVILFVAVLNFLVFYIFCKLVKRICRKKKADQNISQRKKKN